MAIIDILTVIDAQSLMSDYGSNRGTQSSPVFLGDNARKYIFMLVKRDRVEGLEANYELRVKVSTEDTLRWRATSLTLNTHNSALLYRWNASQNGALTDGITPVEAWVKAPLPTFNDKGQLSFPPDTQRYPEFYFETDAQATGTVTYQLYFKLLDEQGNTFGYYYWDPYIDITLR
ncbi:AidA/PixA family protein [Archangium primigenium]|uniref:AidA/PixA family protein n=1 Tax=[Archangium] primigenium TaxID=2792470 RepID=UPI00195A33F1|nr:AidA/PixA family protein [Archangium primigenium]MBM7119323.1 inclusion body family protein [Archangium primigenium]